MKNLPLRKGAKVCKCLAVAATRLSCLRLMLKIRQSGTSRERRQAAPLPAKCNVAVHRSGLPYRSAEHSAVAREPTGAQQVGNDLNPVTCCSPLTGRPRAKVIPRGKKMGKLEPSTSSTFLQPSGFQNILSYF